jgi:hypothetical protein
VNHVDRRCPGASHLTIGEHGRMQGKRLHGIGAKPLGEFVDVLTAGVVEMLTRGKNLNRLRAGSPGEFQQPGMQALCQEKMRRENSQHTKKTPKPA